MPSREDPAPSSPQPISSSWYAQWAAVPAGWRRPVYRIDAAPANTLFLQNRY